MDAEALDVLEGLVAGKAAQRIGAHADAQAVKLFVVVLAGGGEERFQWTDCTARGAQRSRFQNGTTGDGHEGPPRVEILKYEPKVQIVRSSAQDRYTKRLAEIIPVTPAHPGEKGRENHGN